MSEALIKGILSANLVPAQQMTVCNRKQPARLQQLQQTYGVTACVDMQASVVAADVIILAVKPFDLIPALQNIVPLVSEKQLIVSVAAGVSTRTIEQCFGKKVPVVRAMPNTSSFVQASATAICRGRWVTSEQVTWAQRIFSSIGLSVEVSEEQMDAVTGLSGTGPAYLYYVVEALLEAGIACGLSEETSRTLVLQTITGAAKMVLETGKNPAELRRQVSSPNGTTVAAMEVLDAGNVQQLFKQAVQHARQRAGEMGHLVDETFASAGHGQSHGGQI